jgi:hypothetical protein
MIAMVCTTPRPTWLEQYYNNNTQAMNMITQI